MNREVQDGEKPETETVDWESVDVPHDWAISGEFDMKNDVVVDMVIEDGEKVEKRRTGRTGGLPHVGIGWYRNVLDIPSKWKHKNISVEFDGAMSHAQVFLNGEFVGEWPYGYSSFGFELSDKIKFGKKYTGSPAREQGTFVTLVSRGRNLPECPPGDNGSCSYQAMGNLCHHARSQRW